MQAAPAQRVSAAGGTPLTPAVQAPQNGIK
jgi:hypothetical protein